jgi:ketosteroid isomerase-like protein
VHIAKAAEVGGEAQSVDGGRKLTPGPPGGQFSAAVDKVESSSGERIDERLEALVDQLNPHAEAIRDLVAEQGVAAEFRAVRYFDDEDGEEEVITEVGDLVKAIRADDVERFHEQFHDDSVLELPQSGERIVGNEDRRQVYRSFPGRPRVQRILTGGDLAVVEADVDYGDGVDWRAVFICELRAGKIQRLRAYWAEPFKPASRKGTTERREP